MTCKPKSSIHLFPKIDPIAGKRWPIGDQADVALSQVRDALNSQTHRELRLHLRWWVLEWHLRPNLKNLLTRLPEPQRTALPMAMRTLWIPTSKGRARLYLVPDWMTLENLFGKQRVWNEEPLGAATLAPEVEALCLFHLLTVNPRCEDLAGPCPRCDCYYVKKRTSQKVYCTRRCGNAATAVARTRERVASERMDKLARARATMKRWNPASTRHDWKHWVAMKTGIDLRFLTRAVNKGDLIQPEQEK